MAVQDHPLYEEWSQALEALQDANSSLLAVKRQRRGKAMIEGFAKSLELALAEYQDVSDRIFD